MPERLVQARFAAPPAAVLASLTARLHAQGDQLTGISGFGSQVSWNAFDRELELVGMRAEIGPDPEFPGCTLMVVRRDDPALDAALGTALDTADPSRVVPGPWSGRALRRLTG